MEIVTPGIETDRKGVPIIYPTLGPQIIDFIESRFVYGPGPLQGEPYKLRDEFKYILMRAYEHHFPDSFVDYGDGVRESTHGRRRFNFVNLSFPKGCAKSEFAAIIGLTEMHPDAPVRFDGYDPKAPGGMAPGRSVVAPEVLMFAPTLDNLKDLAYGAAMEIARMITDAGIYDVNKDRIALNGEPNAKMKPLAVSPNALDGYKQTFVCIDEPHRWYEDRHREAFSVIQNGLPKRKKDNPWMLTTTTAGDPSEPSVARDQFRAGVRESEHPNKNTKTFFFHRQASDENAKFDTMANRIKALREASGEEASEFRDLAYTASLWDQEGADVSYLERVWCNRWVQSSKTAFDGEAFRDLGDEELKVLPGSVVTVGFDGAQTQDSTAIVITEVSTGIQNLVGLWERPNDLENKTWRVPVSEVDSVMRSIFDDYHVIMLYADPPYWEEQISKWEGLYEGKVIRWYTKTTIPMYYALRAYNEAIQSGALAHDGDPDFVRHVKNAGRNQLNRFDDEGYKMYRLTKISPDRKYDAAMAAVLSWRARLDALAQGVDIDIDTLRIPIRIR